MKWVKILLISSLAVLQFSACSLDSNDDGMSVARMKDGGRGLPVPAGTTIPNMDVQNTQSGDWGRFYSNESADVFRQKLLLMMQTSSSATPLLGTVSPLLSSADGTGVAFKGRLSTSNSLTLASGVTYLDALKSDPSKMQVYIGIFDSYVGAYSNGVTLEPYSFYFGALNSGYNGNMAFEYSSSGSMVSYNLYMIDQYGVIVLQGSFSATSYSSTYTEGVVLYQPKWQGSSATWTQIGNFKIGTCNLFKCS